MRIPRDLNITEGKRAPSNLEEMPPRDLNTVDFFNHLNMLYGTVTEFCGQKECPVMSAGPRYEYLWEDGVTYRRPTKLPAPVYIDNLMNWVQGLLDDETFDLIDKKELVPLEELNDAILAEGESGPNSTPRQR
ncbi:Mitotic exit network component [Tulasnella sp. 332]|nr:Mitotic exit network component [Tulasnella sp. 332]